MPLTVTNVAGGTGYGNPFVSPPDDTVHVKVDLSGLTTAEVDSRGYLKPGLPLTSGGVLVGASGIVYGVTIEPIKLPLTTVPPTDTTLGTETADCLVALGIGVVNRDIAEDNLGRAYTANEIAGFNIAGSKCTLTTT
jgi:hypothetical protein